MEAEKTLLDHLLLHPQGASISDIAIASGHTRATVAKYLERMKAQGKVEYRDVGKSKLWTSSQSHKKILVAEDDAPIRRLISVILGKENYGIIEAADGEEALEKVSEEMPDLILLDVMMPKMNGYEVCDRLKKNALTRKIPIIMLTAKREMTDKVHGVKAGADDYMTKPFEPAELRVRVKAFLDKEVKERHPITNLPRIPYALPLLQKGHGEMYLLSLQNLDQYKRLYGHAKTNEAVRLIAQIIVHCAERISAKGVVVHDEGNNFLLSLQKDSAEAAIKEIQEEFDSTLLFLYEKHYESLDLKRKLVFVGEESARQEKYLLLDLSVRKLQKEDVATMAALTRALQGGR
ncbi:MAG: hypothetical protein A2Z88_00770 [Omnitrophica WOR_2 bacterium GWA2_47_8]|nr:MAG: hypothetical protein A2Z88_00770 [Omnitrophica WOR_2 bacterium GWA2_47_8]